MSGDVWPLIEGKSVLFITTKNLDYIRNAQELKLIGSKAKSVTTLGFKGGSYPSRLIKIYRRLCTMSFKPYDVIFIGFAPQLVLPFFGPRFRNKTVVIDFFISMYDTLIFDRKKFSARSPAGRLLHFFDQTTIRRADAIIADTRAHAGYFEQEFSAPRDSISILYLEADTSIYSPRPQAKSAADSDKFIVHYFGSILPLQGIEVILQAARLLKDEGSIVFDLVGPVPESIGSRYADLQNVRFTPWLPQEKLAEHIAAADLCLAGHFSAGIAKASRTIPGKAYIYGTMRRPMILGDNPANHELFEADSLHSFVKMGDPAALAQKILEIKAGL